MAGESTMSDYQQWLDKFPELEVGSEHTVGRCDCGLTHLAQRDRNVGFHIDTEYSFSDRVGVKIRSWVQPAGDHVVIEEAGPIEVAQISPTPGAETPRPEDFTR